MAYSAGCQIYNSICSFGNFLSGGAISIARFTLTKALRFFSLINAVSREVGNVKKARRFYDDLIFYVYGARLGFYGVMCDILAMCPAYRNVLAINLRRYIHHRKPSA